MTKTIKVTVSPIGESKVEAIGFAGVGCTDATKAIEMAVSGGDGNVTREFKPEWNDNSSSNTTDVHMTW